MIEIKCQHGLGDNILARPFIKAWAKHRPLFLNTPWPELFSDLPVSFLKPESRLRTQAKNIASLAHFPWAPRPPGLGQSLQLQYNDATIKRFGSITKVLEAMMPLPTGEEYELDLPAALRPGFRNANAVVRPVTIRSEWTNTARNPKPEYVAAICERLMQTHEVVLIADLKEREEWLDGPLPPHHRAYLKGELPVTALLKMVGEANLVVGGVGWLVPAAIAIGARAFIIRGGQGAHNSAAVVTDPRMNLSNIYFAEPDRPCMCNAMRHECDKTISNINDKFNEFGNQIGAPK